MDEKLTAALAQLHDGDIYIPSEPALMEAQEACLEKLYDFNQTRPGQQAERAALLQEMFAEIGEDCYIEPPLRANWGGRHVHFGRMVYANFGLTLVDDTHIYVGDHVMFGPNVVIATAAHPVSPAARKRQAQYNLPVHIGSNVWIGAGAMVMPGVTIGDDTVIGAGSVVTKDIPAGVVAVGNPCRVLRPINENDKTCYRAGMAIPKEML